MLQGVTLDDYAASGLELGVPEVLFVDRRPRADWDLEPISKGRLDPERQRDRIEVVAPAPSSRRAPAAEAASPRRPPPPPRVPKSAEEAYSVPSPYRIVFAEGVSLEVRSRGEGRRNRSLLRRLADAAGLRLSDLGSALGLGSKDRIRLRVTLEAEDAAVALPLAPAGRGPDRRRPAAPLRRGSAHGRAGRRRIANASAGFRTSSVWISASREAGGAQRGHERVEQERVRAVAAAARLAHVVPARVLRHQHAVEAVPAVEVEHGLDVASRGSAARRRRARPTLPAARPTRASPRSGSLWACTQT